MNCPHCGRWIDIEAEHADVASPSAPQPAEPIAIEHFWMAVERGWDIEPRSYFEQHAVAMGFRSPVEMAVHWMWKRHAKEWPNPELAASLSAGQPALRAALEAILDSAGPAGFRHDPASSVIATALVDDARAVLASASAGQPAALDDPRILMDLGPIKESVRIFERAGWSRVPPEEEAAWAGFAQSARQFFSLAVDAVPALMAEVERLRGLASSVSGSGQPEKR